MIHAYNRRHLAEKARTARKMPPEDVDTIDDISDRSKMGKYVTVNLIFTLAAILIGVGASWALIIMMAGGPSSHKLFMYSYLLFPAMIFSMK